MEASEFVMLSFLATGGEIRGKTKLQKTVFFLGLMTHHLDDLGYRPHFYGPYSDEVASAISKLRAIGALDQNVSDWGYDRSGFEVKRYEFRLNEPGRTYAESIAENNQVVWNGLQKSWAAFQKAGDKDYMTLSVAAKTYFLLGKQKAPATDAELSQLASRFGWSVSPEQVSGAVDYLVDLNLVERVKK